MESNCRQQTRSGQNDEILFFFFKSAVYKHLLLYRQCLQKPFFHSWVNKVVIVWHKVQTDNPAFFNYQTIQLLHQTQRSIKSNPALHETKVPPFLQRIELCW